MSAGSGNRTSAPVQALDHKSNSLPLGYRACTFSIQFPQVQIEGEDIDMEKELIPYEFQDAMEQSRIHFEDSEFGQSEAELNELNAIAEQIDEYSYSVRLFPGQVINLISRYELFQFLLFSFHY